MLEHRDVGCRRVEQRLRERHEAIAQGAEQRLEALEAHAGLEVIEQRVVARAVALQQIGLLDLEAHQLLERGPVIRKALRLAGVLPRLIGGGTLLRHRAHERLWQLGCLVTRSARLAHHRLLGDRQVGQRGRSLDRLAVRGIDQALMRDRSDRRTVMSTCAAATGRTHRLLVPAEQTHDAAKVALLVHPRLEGAPCVGHLPLLGVTERLAAQKKRRRLYPKAEATPHDAVDQSTISTSIASGPFWPSRASKVTFAPSRSVRKPEPATLV